MKIWYTKSGYRIIQLLAGRSNVFLLTNGAQYILVDTGMYYMWGKLQKRLADLHLNHLDYLIMTHSHMDHAGNCRKIQNKYHPLVIIHRSEAPNLGVGDFIVPSGTNIFTRLFVKLLARPLAPMLSYEACQPNMAMNDLLDLDDFGFHATIMHTPGHSCGSVSVIIDDEIALVGDTMVGTFKWSVYPPFADDTKQLMDSWEKLLATGCSLFIPSHGTANSRALVQRSFNKRKSI